MHIAPEIRRLVDAIGQRAPGLAAVWLIGSRANGTEKPTSDWDFIAIGTAETLTYLRAAAELHHANVDFLVVTNGDDFEASWGERDKHGSLAEWQWEQLDERSAVYLQSKWRDAVDGAGAQLTRVHARRVWP